MSSSTKYFSEVQFISHWFFSTLFSSMRRLMSSRTCTFWRSVTKWNLLMVYFMIAGSLPECIHNSNNQLARMFSTVYIHSSLHYFFCSSELIDLQIGRLRSSSISLFACIDVLEQSSTKKHALLDASLALLAHLLVVTKGPGEDASVSEMMSKRAANEYRIEMQWEVADKFYSNEGLKISLFALKNYLQLVRSAEKTQIIDQMILKTLINLFYIGLMYWHQKSAPNKQARTKEIAHFLEQSEVDNLMISMVTLTLQAYYLPIKKLVMLYTRVLSLLFGNPAICDDSALLKMCNDNLLPEDYVRVFKNKNSLSDMVARRKKSPIEDFYSKHNIGDCPLAQSIVVGLLRSLLTICNSQTHKKFTLNVPKGSGADSYREWQVSYQFVIVNQQYRSLLDEDRLKQLQDYEKYNESIDAGSPCHNQFYSHKIYSTAAIANFFSFLLLSFRQNIYIQYSYLYQLISDANGILVFLKFLTDKFDRLQPHPNSSILTAQGGLQLQDEVMLTVYAVLIVLYGACNNYAEKTRSYLFEYNSYLIIKKIPHLFMKAHKNDEQLPSKQEMQEQFGGNGTPLRAKVRNLTELCYDLLKIQIPFFSKKMKESANNMRMIVDIYCQLPKKTEPIYRSEFDKIVLKSKLKKVQAEKHLRSVEQLKIAHNEFNNYYYWANEQVPFVPIKQQFKEEWLPPNRQEMDKWLQENVWKYYD